MRRKLKSLLTNAVILTAAPASMYKHIHTTIGLRQLLQCQVRLPNLKLQRERRSV